MKGSLLPRFLSRVARRVCFVGVFAWSAQSCACSLLIDSELERVHCTEENVIGPPACEPGQVCGAGLCTPCASVDACSDGVDNDCDERVDEGCADAAAGDASR